jgi:Ni,Fe-hydrogenase III large subunit
MIRPGGLRIDLDAARIDRLLKRLNDVTRDTLGAMDVFFDSPSCLARLERTGTVSRSVAEILGLVGVAGRASGLDMDARRDFPIPGLEGELQLPAVENDGDVLSRANVRRREIIASIDWLKQVLTRLPEGEVMAASETPRPGRICVSAVEGWRGEVVHVAMTDTEGKYSRYKIVDPSFHNWSGLAMALRGQQISDFPLCNKSFNLSYCGFDL